MQALQALCVQGEEHAFPCATGTWIKWRSLQRARAL